MKDDIRDGEDGVSVFRKKEKSEKISEETYIQSKS
jgi:hypothetical protein